VWTTPGDPACLAGETTRWLLVRCMGGLKERITCLCTASEPANTEVPVGLRERADSCRCPFGNATVAVTDADGVEVEDVYPEYPLWSVRWVSME